MRPALPRPILLAIALACAASLGATRAATIQQPPVFTVAVLGDGFGEALTQGLQLDLAGEPGLAVQPAVRAGAGLLGDATTDWGAIARSLADDRRIGAVVIMLGADDWHVMRDGDTDIEPDTPRWEALYGDRVAALVAAFRDKGLPVTWVGLPIMADEETATAFGALNAIVRARAERAGARYVDTWNAFADENGRYDASGPDKDGHTVLLRTTRGRFTRAGEIKLASFVDGELRRARDEAVSAFAATTDVVLPHEPEVENDINAQIRRELGLPALHPASRAAAGPTVLVTAAPRSPGGQLVDTGPRPAPLAYTGGATLAQRVLVEGRPLPPKAGRLDDFTWPRP